MPEKPECQTYSIPEVARLFGIGRNQAYEAARRGDFPILEFGKSKRAPKRAIDRMLEEGNRPKTAVREPA